MRSVTKALTGLVFAASLALAGAAHADEPMASDGANVEIMSGDELNTLSGGAAIDNRTISLTEQNLLASNHDNTVIGHEVGSGDVIIANGALSDFAGIGNFVMNTGHQNNLQASMNVTIQLGAGS